MEFESIIRSENGATTYPVLLVDKFAAVFRRMQQFVDPAHAGIYDAKQAFVPRAATSRAATTAL